IARSAQVPCSRSCRGWPPPWTATARMASRDGEHPCGGCPAMRAYLEGRSRRRAYPPNTIERLIEGEIWIGEDERWMPASPTWAEARSLIEHHGNVESEACVEMLDLERAISRLASRHRAAAALVILTLFGWSRDEISRVLDLH